MPEFFAGLHESECAKAGGRPIPMFIVGEGKGKRADGEQDDRGAVAQL